MVFYWYPAEAEWAFQGLVQRLVTFISRCMVYPAPEFFNLAEVDP